FSRIALNQAKACALLLSTSVPSTSKITVRYASFGQWSRFAVIQAAKCKDASRRSWLCWLVNLQGFRRDGRRVARRKTAGTPSRKSSRKGGAPGSGHATPVWSARREGSSTRTATPGRGALRADDGSNETPSPAATSRRIKSG